MSDDEDEEIYDHRIKLNKITQKDISDDEMLL